MLAPASPEITAVRETLDFLSGKFDFKIPTFGDFGHPGVYSAAPPYVHTDLTAGLAVENAYRWGSEEMEMIHDHSWRRLDCA